MLNFTSTGMYVATSQSMEKKSMNPTGPKEVLRGAHFGHKKDKRKPGDLPTRLTYLTGTSL